MTDYQAYTPSEYAPDAPATALHFQRWFENWIAGFEGAVGAPRLQPGALQGPVAGSAYSRVICPIYRTPAASTYGTIDGAHQNDAVTISAIVLVGGVIRCTAQHRGHTTQAGQENWLRLMKNGVLVQEWMINTAGASYTTRSVDVTVAAGDVLAWQSKHVGNLGTYPSSWGYVSFLSANNGVFIA